MQCGTPGQYALACGTCVHTCARVCVHMCGSLHVCGVYMCGSSRVYGVCTRVYAWELLSVVYTCMCMYVGACACLGWVHVHVCSCAGACMFVVNVHVHVCMHVYRCRSSYVSLVCIHVCVSKPVGAMCAYMYMHVSHICV